MPILKLVETITVGLLLWTAALGLGWFLLSLEDFGYARWYSSLGIADHIQQYAPHNPYRMDFAKTTQSTHERLVHSINYAIHDHPSSLHQLGYHAGNQWYALLTQPEIHHLKQVAYWVSLGQWLVIFAVFGVLGRVILARYYGYNLTLPSLVAGLCLPLAALLVWLALQGHGVYEQLHEWLFNDSPWFFYWEDSLMTTLFKAPYWFYGVAAEWLALSTVLLLGLIWGILRCQKA